MYPIPAFDRVPKNCITFKRNSFKIQMLDILIRLFKIIIKGFRFEKEIFITIREWLILIRQKMSNLLGLNVNIPSE